MQNRELDNVWETDYRDGQGGEQRNKSSTTLLLVPLPLYRDTTFVPIYVKLRPSRITSLPIIPSVHPLLPSAPFHSFQDPGALSTTRTFEPGPLTGYGRLVTLPTAHTANTDASRRQTVPHCNCHCPHLPPVSASFETAIPPNWSVACCCDARPAHPHRTRSGWASTHRETAMAC